MPRSTPGSTGFFGRLTIGQRLAGGFGVLVLLVAGLGVMAQIQMATLADLTTKLYRHPFAVSNAVLHVRADVLAIHRSMKDVALSRDAAGIDAAAALVDTHEQAILAQFDIIHERFLGDRRMVEAAETAIVDWRPIRDQVITLMEAGARDEAASITRGVGADQVALIDETVTALYDFAQNKADQFMVNSETIRARTVVTMWALCGGGILIGLLVAFVIARSITRPIGSMTGAVARLAEGDKTADVPGLDRGDEIGRMAKAVGVFKDSLVKNEELQAAAAAEQQTRDRRAGALDQASTTFEADMQAMLGVVTGAVDQMQTTANALNRSADHANGEAGAVATAAQQASANVQTVAAAAEELGQSIQEISRQVSHQSDIAGSASESMGAADQRVRDLATGVQQIGEIVTLITSIAEQTNLLALNATIEAARAGDAGKGFAVVASEVKGLATQTAKATEDIAAKIKEIQDRTDGTVEAIDQVSARLAEMTEIAATVASAVEEQNAATREISHNASQAATGTTDVSRGIDGVTRAAGETGSASTQVLDSSQSLATQADALTARVERFLADVKTA